MYVRSKELFSNARFIFQLILVLKIKEKSITFTHINENIRKCNNQRKYVLLDFFNFVLESIYTLVIQNLLPSFL